MNYAENFYGSLEFREHIYFKPYIFHMISERIFFPLHIVRAAVPFCMQIKE